MRYLMPLILCIMAVKPALKSQCIQDVRYIVESPFPCFFIGMVDMSQQECFDPTQTSWKYRWVIRSADSGEEIATYQGFAFAHSFQKFGGYEFCLEIDKDGNPLTPPEVSECVRYTTCEFCEQVPIEVNYMDCGVAEGCEVELSATIPAENARGLKPFARYVVTYHPTTFEALGGGQPFDIIYDDIPITFHPDEQVITVKDNVKIPYSRGCYRPRLVFDIEWGAGAHSDLGGSACLDLSLQSSQFFRCLACYDGSKHCTINEFATTMTNEVATCESLPCSSVTKAIKERTKPKEVSTGQTPSRFAVFPNPVSDLLYVEIPDLHAGSSRVLVTDLAGMPLYDSEVTTRSIHPVSTADWPAGYYLVMLLEDGKPVHSERIVVLPR